MLFFPDSEELRPILLNCFFLPTLRYEERKTDLTKSWPTSEFLELELWLALFLGHTVHPRNLGFVFVFFFFRKISLYHKSKLKFSILLCLVCFLMYVMGDDFVELVSR